MPARLFSASLIACVLGLLLLAVAGPLARGMGLAPGVPQWGPDIQISTLFTDPPVQRNSSFAVDPTNPDHVLVGYESNDPGRSSSAIGESTDGGLTWANQRFYGPWISNTIPFGNPHVDFDHNGTAYYSTQIEGDQ